MGDWIGGRTPNQSPKGSLPKFRQVFCLAVPNYAFGQKSFSFPTRDSTQLLDVLSPIKDSFQHNDMTASASTESPSKTEEYRVGNCLSARECNGVRHLAHLPPQMHNGVIDPQLMLIAAVLLVGSDPLGLGVPGSSTPGSWIATTIRGPSWFNGGPTASKPPGSPASPSRLFWADSCGSRPLDCSRMRAMRTATESCSATPESLTGHPGRFSPAHSAISAQFLIETNCRLETFVSRRKQSTGVASTRDIFEDLSANFWGESPWTVDLSLAWDPLQPVH